jgi:REP element-mobilizing transposase RayT
MPRTARLDIPDLLQHVIVRGNERRDIFLDDDDRRDFVQRLQRLLEQTGVECLAWSLMSNHFHLLLRPRLTSLAQFMRRLLTGYAVSFNLRHNRTGHLFQNRYKSLVCDEDSYLLELMRYIHLNPLRVGIVPDLGGLDRFPWSGHSVMMGKSSMPGQNTEEVLRCFGRRSGEARRRYRLFIEDGIAMGTREDLAGSRRVPMKEPGAAPDLVADSRILGDVNFVERLREHDALKRRIPEQEPIPEIIRRVAEKLGVSPQAISSKSRQSRILDARTMVCHAAIKAGHSGAEVARHLRMTRSGVFTAMKRGKAPLGSSNSG